MMYSILKSLHLFLIISWFAGLFYLPRLYVNLAMQETNSLVYKQLLSMAQKLYRFMTPLGISGILIGVWLAIHSFGFKHGWIHGKLLCGILLMIYHFYCGKILRNFQHQRNIRSHKWFRVFNELPVFILISAIYFAVYKPF